jgi:hypothetical protein
MFLLNADLDEPYVPFVSGRHAADRAHEVRRSERKSGRARRTIGRAIIRAGQAFAGSER